MKKRLPLFTKLSLVLFSFLIFTSCEGDKYYYEDPSAVWKVIDDLTVNSAGSSYSNRWEWDNARKEYYCILNLPELNDNIYDNGIVVGYVFFGEYGVNEVQYQLPIVHLDGTNISYEVSFDNSRTACFYFHWDDFAQRDPGLYNFKLVLLSPSVIK